MKNKIPDLTRKILMFEDDLEIGSCKTLKMIDKESELMEKKINDMSDFIEDCLQDALEPKGVGEITWLVEYIRDNAPKLLKMEFKK